jgi:hypothetical protein
LPVGAFSISKNNRRATEATATRWLVRLNRDSVLVYHPDQYEFKSR